MEKLTKLKALREQALAKAKGLMAKAVDGVLATADQTEFDASMDEAERLDGEIATAQNAVDRISRLNTATASAGPRTRIDTTAPTAPVGVVASLRELAQDDPNRGFRSPREFFGAVMRAGQNVGNRAAVDPRLLPLMAAAGSDEQQGGQDIYGGFLIPQGFSPTLLQVQSEEDPTAGRVMALPMATVSVSIPARTDKDHTTSVTGGLQWTRRPETVAGTASRMGVEQVQLKANSLMGLNYTSEELLVDSPISVAALLAAGFRAEYQATILNEKLFGTGSGQFLGVMNAPCLVSVAKESGQAGTTIVSKNVQKMRSRCWGYSQAIWLANHDTYPQLSILSVAVGTGGQLIYQSSVVEDRPDTLLGRPIFYTEFAQTLGAAGDLILGNWSQYIEGTLQGMDMQESIHVRFVNNERTFRATVRNDGQPWWKSALTPKKSSATLSPFVALDARS